MCAGAKIWAQSRNLLKRVKIRGAHSTFRLSTIIEFHHGQGKHHMVLFQMKEYLLSSSLHGVKYIVERLALNLEKA